MNGLSPEDWHYETELFRNEETCNLNKGYHANTENNQSRINKINVAAITTTNHDEIDANDVLAKNIFFKNNKVQRGSDPPPPPVQQKS